MSNILVTGASGQLGSEIKTIYQEFSEYQFFFTDIEELDICSKEDLRNFIEVNNINAIVNCAAYTAVDKAESEPEIANNINHIAVEHMASLAKEKGLRLVHISTDYVFDGMGHKPYPVDYPTKPVNVYGNTKLLGEKAIQKLSPDYGAIIRTSWVYSSFGGNFVKTMLRLGKERDQIKVICDQVGVPTYAADLARFILEKVLKSDKKSLSYYHYTNEGACSWYDFAVEIFELSAIDCRVIPIPTTSYPTPAKRPFYSLMDKSSIKNDFYVVPPYWRNSLKKCIQILDN
ncbi:MAG: dTDP-4-dehydrorhamnose reductase [Leeuwenhoekiella sp.]